MSLGETSQVIKELIGIRESSTQFLIPIHGDIFIGPILPEGESFWYLLNGLFVLAKGPLFLCSLYFCPVIIITTNPHPEGLFGTFSKLSEDERREKFHGVIEDPVNGIRYENGTVDILN